MKKSKTSLKSSITGDSNIITKKNKTGFSLWQILLPIGISLLVVAFLMKENITADSFRAFVFTRRSITSIGLAIIAWGVQNLAMGHRYYTLAYPYMSKWGAMRVTFLIEFASAITPSAVGGSSVVFLFMAREGVSVGRATAITISGLFLDELFMTLVCLVSLFFVNQGLGIDNIPALSVGLNITLITLAIILFLWTLALYISLFHKSSWVGNILLWITSWKPLRRWRRNAMRMKYDLQITSKEMLNMNWMYWFKLIGATIISWGARFAIACILIYGFTSIDVSWAIEYVKQMIIWLIALITPTPGGSGFAEYMFQIAYNEYFPNPAIALMIALIWRVITSFSYIVIGPIALMYQLRKKEKIQQ